MNRIAGVLLVALVALVATGCGSTPGAAGPALSTGLQQVDAAAVANDPEALAAAVADLLRAVGTAESAGHLSAASAEEIRAAAGALLDAAEPDSPGSPTSSVVPEVPTTTAPPPTDEDDAESGDDNDEDEDEDESSPGTNKDAGKSTDHDQDD